MNTHVRRVIRGFGLGLLLAGGMFNNASGQAAAGALPAFEAVDKDNAASANSTISELQQLMQSRSVSELRTTYNGNYGVSLMFKPDGRIYYVALFQQKNFWRVVRTTSDAQAEKIYMNFAGETEKLAEVEIRRIKLEAEKQYTEKLISTQEARLSALQNDLAVQKQQEQNVAIQQDQGRQRAQVLNRKQQAARIELRILQNRIRALEVQQSTLENGNLSDGKADSR